MFLNFLITYRKWVPNQVEPDFHSIFHKIQFGLSTGPLIYKINHDLYKIYAFISNYIWFFNCSLIFPSTVKKIKEKLPNTTLIPAHDNPFSKFQKKSFWRNYVNSVKYHDIHFYVRETNKKEYLNNGARRVHLLKQFFIPKKDFPKPKKEIPKKFISEVVFAGHYEDDGRLEALELILKNGFKLKVFGGGWQRIYSKLPSNSLLKKQFPILPAKGIDYQNAICGSKIALCFFSKINLDNYTTRNFEIPAMKTTLLSEYSKD